jgi:hypothetical protein
MTTTLPKPAPETPAHRVTGQGAQTVLAVVGAVCGTLIVGAVGTAPAAKLVGAALGAAIPALMTHAGPYPLARAVAGIAVTAGFVVTYGGFTLFDYATDRPATFPLPPSVPQPDATPDPPITSSGSTSRSAAGLGITVSPRTLRCSAEDGCDRTVSVRSTGSRDLEIGAVEIDGPAAANFSQDGGCNGATLPRDEGCEIAIGFTAGADETAEARLVIHQNLPGDPTFVGLVGSGSGATPGVDLEPVVESCRYRLALGSIDPELLLTVALAVDDPDASPAEAVAVAASIDGGDARSTTVPIAGGTGEIVLPVSADQLDRELTVAVTADPANDVAEAAEDNNVLNLQVTVPAGLQEGAESDC